MYRKKGAGPGDWALRWRSGGKEDHVQTRLPLQTGEVLYSMVRNHLKEPLGNNCS